MKTKIIIAGCLVSNLLFSQTEIKKPLPEFNQLIVDLNTTVYLKRMDAPCVMMLSEDTGFTASVSDGKLHLLPGNSKHIPEKVTVGYVNLSDIAVNVPASIKSDEVIKGDKFQVNLNGAAKCKLELAVNNLLCLLTGASTASLSGTVTKMEAVVSGAASLKAENLTAENALVNTSGAATAKVNVVNQLIGNTSGASTLKFSGDPKETQLNQSGASTIKKKEGSGETESTSSAPTAPGDTVKHFRRNGGRYELLIHEKTPEDTANKKKNIHKQNWAGIDLFQNGYLTPDNNITLATNHDYLSPDYGIKNMGWSLNLFEKDFRMAKGKLQFVTGLGFSFNSFALKNKTVLNPDSSFTSYSYNTAASYSKNKLRESFVTVPLLFELNTSRKDNRNFHIAFGVIGGVKLGSSQKQQYSIGGHTIHEIKRDDYNLFPFKLDATVRVGYGDFTMFATYSLTPLFEYGKGPELYPFTVGIRIVPF